MKKALAMIAVIGLIAAPLAAAPLVQLGPERLSSQTITGTLQNGTLTGSRTPAGYSNGSENLYDNMAAGFGVGGPAASFTGTAAFGAATMMIDDVHINSSLASATLGGLHWLFYNPAVSYYGGPGPGPGAPTTDTIAFFSNPGGLNTAIGATIAAFGVGPLNTGFILQTVNFTGSGLVLPKDSWVGFRKSAGSVIYLFGGSPSVGSSSPALATGTGGGTTFAATVFSSLGTGLGSPGTGSMFMAMDGVPEPAAIALLSLGGLVALRRRRLA